MKAASRAPSPASSDVAVSAEAPFHRHPSVPLSMSRRRELNENPEKMAVSYAGGFTAPSQTLPSFREVRPTFSTGS